MTQLRVHAIDPAYLNDIRAAGTDGHGNRPLSLIATGAGEPLRCCLRYAEAGEAIMLISYAPFARPSVWREVGPVYVHAGACAGHLVPHALPVQLSHGPRVLRAYRFDGAMDYDHNTLVRDPIELAPVIEGLLAEPGVATVHVRTVTPQCFLYAVTADRGGPDAGVH